MPSVINLPSGLGGVDIVMGEERISMAGFNLHRCGIQTRQGQSHFRQRQTDQMAGQLI